MKIPAFIIAELEKQRAPVPRREWLWDQPDVPPSPSMPESGQESGCDSDSDPFEVDFSI